MTEVVKPRLNKVFEGNRPTKIQTKGSNWKFVSVVCLEPHTVESLTKMDTDKTKIYPQVCMVMKVKFYPLRISNTQSRYLVFGIKQAI